MSITSKAVYGLEESIVASGFPMQTNCPDDGEFATEVIGVQQALMLGDFTNPHIKRAFKLGGTKQGEGHDNFLNGIIVQFNWDIPIKIWTEAERYHFLDFVSLN